MKTYAGHREDGKAVVMIIERGCEVRPLPLRLDLWRHSPTGFEWGYAGSGPAQLAWAMLADALEDDALASQLHQRFKFEVIARLAPLEPWTMTEQQVRQRAMKLTSLEGG